MPGATMLSALAAQRERRRLCRIARRRWEWRCPAACACADAHGMMWRWTDKRIGAIVIGPGLGSGDEARAHRLDLVLDERIDRSSIDADALNRFWRKVRGSTDWRERSRHPSVLTPHDGRIWRACSAMVQRLTALDKCAGGRGSDPVPMLLLKGASPRWSRIRTGVRRSIRRHPRGLRAQARATCSPASSARCWRKVSTMRSKRRRRRCMAARPEAASVRRTVADRGRSCRMRCSEGDRRAVSVSDDHPHRCAAARESLPMARRCRWPHRATWFRRATACDHAGRCIISTPLLPSFPDLRRLYSFSMSMMRPMPDFLVDRISGALGSQGLTANVRDRSPPHLSPPRTRRRASLRAERDRQAGRCSVFNEGQEQERSSILPNVGCSRRRSLRFAVGAIADVCSATLVRDKRGCRDRDWRLTDQGVDLLISTACRSRWAFGDRGAHRPLPKSIGVARDLRRWRRSGRRRASNPSR